MIYLDNSATTPLSESAKEKIKEMLDIFGNPSSLHSEGLRAEKEVTLARETVAKSLSARADEVYFTSGGTESDNIAIFGSARKNAKAGRKVITTDSEHFRILGYYEPCHDGSRRRNGRGISKNTHYVE